MRRVLENSNCRIKNYTPHALRHGYGSILLSKGTDIKIVSKLLGHRSVSTTYDIYIDVYKEDVANMVKETFEAPKVTENKQESKKDIVAQLREYKSLLDDGIITEEEFALMKSKLL